MTPRSVWLVLALLAAVFVFNGCGGGAEETVKGHPPRFAPEQNEKVISQVRRGGVARLVLPREPSCLNPYLEQCPGADVLTGITLEPPLMLGPDQQYKPILAEVVPSFSNGMLKDNPFSVTYRLREGVRWSDGEPLTSADAKWTYDSTRSTGNELAPAYQGWQEVSSVEAPDARTVRITFKQPYADWQRLLTTPVLPQHVYGRDGFSRLTLNQDPVGSGPFILKSQTTGAMTFQRNPRYWNGKPPLPNLDGLEVRFADSGAAAAALASGQADFGMLDAADMARAESSSNLQFAPATEGRYLAWSSRLNGPRPNTPISSFAWNIAQWGFFK